MTGPERHDRAVAFCCDRNYYPFALFMIRQIAFHNPNRQFDIVVSTLDDLQVPDWARDLGVIIHAAGALPPDADVGRLAGKMAQLSRLLLARDLGDRYRRILYLDCDMFVEGGDINRLLDVDLGPHPFGAVLDAPFFYKSNHRAKEYVKAGLPAAPYANTGLQVIDTKAYREQEVARRSLDICKTHPHAIVLADQSLTNLAMYGKFAQLAPCWNWQLNRSYPLVPWRYPVFLRHFISKKKPDRDSSGWHDARFSHAYREFFTALMPEALARLSAPCDPAPMPVADASWIVWRHLRAMKIVERILARHPDPYRAVL